MLPIGIIGYGKIARDQHVPALDAGDRFFQAMKWGVDRDQHFAGQMRLGQNQLAECLGADPLQKFGRQQLLHALRWPGNPHQPRRQRSALVARQLKNLFALKLEQLVRYRPTGRNDGRLGHLGQRCDRLS